MLGAGGKKDKQQFQAQSTGFPSDISPFVRDTLGISYKPNM